LGKFVDILKRLGSPFAPKPRYFGLNELDRKLGRWLDFDNGVFVEAGANNGTSQSNTCHFERYRGWTGLLVEPIPEMAALCRKNRPGSIVENCALGPPEREGTEMTLTYCNLMTVAEGGLLAGEGRADHVARGASLQNVEPYDFTVRCRTLSSLLDHHAIAYVDLLSLDVEGFEVEALKGLDLDRHAPAHILVEARDEAGVRAVLAGRYDELARLSHHDILFGSRSNR
jgi:FkbM family methyltransferase